MSALGSGRSTSGAQQRKSTEIVLAPLAFMHVNLSAYLPICLSVLVPVYVSVCGLMCLGSLFAGS